MKSLPGFDPMQGKLVDVECPQQSATTITLTSWIFTIPAIYVRALGLMGKSNVTWYFSVCFPSKPNDDLIAMRIVQFEFWQDSRHYCFKSVSTFRVATAPKEVTIILFIHNSLLSSSRWKVLYFLLSRINSCNWKFFHLFAPWETTWHCFSPTSP